MRHLIRNTVLAIAVVIICAAAIYPPDKNLRRGRDLAGGVSLIYAVQTPEDADRAATIQQTIEVLKERVDPQGTLEISFVRQGRNRIEVQMPLRVRDDVLWLPPAAIRTFQDRVFVVLETPDGPRTVDVEIGLRTGERVEIISGVSEGDVVIAP